MTGLPELGVETVQLDVASADSRRAAVDAVVAAAGCIDVLVNNAGMGLVGPIVEADLAAVRYLFEVNLFGLLGELCCSSSAPLRWRCPPTALHPDGPQG
jgi:1-acylglycerone phosphate reductase